MDQLPPTVADDELLDLIGKVLAIDPPLDSTSELRLRFFQPEFSWQACVGLAVEQDVLPAFISALNRRSLLLPVPTTLSGEARAAHVTTRLASAYQEHLDRQADLRAQLVAILAALNSHSIVPLLLKGAVHLTIAQPEWHEARSMRDLDILVPASEAETANRVLSSMGYRPDRDPPPLDRHLPELRLPDRSGTVEIHTEALAFSARHALTTEEVWTRAEPQTFVGTALRLLPPEWHLLQGMLHHQIADRGHARRLLAIKGLWEFAMVGSGISPSAWHAIIEHAEKRGILDVLASWVVQANRLFGFKSPDGLVVSAEARKHAEATFSRARVPYQFRQAAFVFDKLRFAFNRETLAIRYGRSRSVGLAALRHFVFLMRRYRSQLAQRWLRR